MLIIRIQPVQQILVYSNNFNTASTIINMDNAARDIISFPLASSF